MSSIRSSILIIVLMVSMSECEDWCSLIKPNGSYKGLGIYHRWYERHEGKAEYVMFNRAGYEWKFEITGSPQTGLKEMNISLIEGSLKRVDDRNVVNRFGIYVEEGSLPSLKDYVGECSVLESVEQGYNISCQEYKSQTKIINLPKDLINVVIMKVSPRENWVLSLGSYVLLISKDKKSHLFYDPTANTLTSECGLSRSKCKIPQFVGQLNDSLFENIDGVVDYNYGKGYSGWLVLFSIDQTLKYCFTAENQNISEEVRHRVIEY